MNGNIAPCGIGIRADFVRHPDELLAYFSFHSRQLDMELNIQPECAFRCWPNAYPGNNRRLARILMLATCGHHECRLKARGIASGEKLFRVGSHIPGATHLLRRSQLQLQHTIRGLSSPCRPPVAVTSAV